MRDELIRESLGLLERPSQPPPGVANALFARLVAELDETSPSEQTTTTFDGPPPAGGRRKRPLIVAPVAAALVALVVAVTLVTDVFVQPRSALAVIADARLRFSSVSPFEAEVVRVHSVADNAGLPGDLDTAGLPDLEIVRHVRYVDERRWQVTVLANSYSTDPDLDPALGFVANERPGDLQVADGELLGTYVSASQRYLVGPLHEHDAGDLRHRGTAGLAPHAGGTVPWLADEDLDRYCTVGDDVTVLARRATPISCAPRGGDPSLFLTVDAETGMLLRLESTVGDRGQPLEPPHLIEVRSLRFDDVDTTFEVAPPAGARTVWVGQGPAPDAYRIQPGSEVADSFRVDTVVQEVLAAGGGLFVLSSPHGYVGTDAPPMDLSRLDPVTGETIWRTPIDRHVGSLAVGAGYVWLAGTRDTGAIIGDEDANRQVHESFLQRYDPATGDAVGDPLVVHDSDRGHVVVVDDQVWFTGGPLRPDGTGGHLGTILRLDSDTLTTVQQIPLDLALAWWRPDVSDGSLWVLGWPPVDVSATDAVAVDLRTGGVAGSVRLPSSHVSTFTVTSGAIWMATTDTAGVAQQTLYRIDPTSGAVTGTVTVGPQPAAIVVTGGIVWVVDQEEALLRGIEATSLQLVRELTVGGAPRSMSTDGDSLWIADHQGAVKRVPLR